MRRRLQRGSVAPRLDGGVARASEKCVVTPQVGACGAAPDKGQNQNCLLEGVSDRPGTLVLSRTLFWEQVSDK